MKILQVSLWLFVAVAFSTLSCGPDAVYPDIPQLSYKDYSYNGTDSLRVKFTFTDGDGDIGVAANGTDPNMLLTLYYKDVDGNYYIAYQPGNPTVPITYEFRIGELPETRNGLQGEIHVDINSLMITYNEIQFDAVLIDQAQHRSPVVRTQEIRLQ